MATGPGANEARVRLNRDRVLRAAVDLADREGLDAISMRNLADHLGVVPMALYKHVANKERLLDGMVDMIVGEIGPPPHGLAWKRAVRTRVLAARNVMLRHGWARDVVESRTQPTLTVLGYMDSVIGLFRAGGLSVDLTHHLMHALGSRIWGFTSDLFGGGAPLQPHERDAMAAVLAAQLPYVAEIVAVIGHDADSVVGGGCDDQAEFEFALDLFLDGAERLHKKGWSSR
jgi:AcrR family transcriptional regulator